MASDKDKKLVELGILIKNKRNKRGLTQAELAYSIDKDQPSINRLEKGRINPSYLYLLEICEGLDIGIDELFIST